MSSLQLVRARFGRAELGFKLLGGPLAGSPDIFQLDIHRSPNFGEYFRLWPGAKENHIEVLGYDRAFRQVVLFVKEARRPFRQLVPKRAGLPREQVEAQARRDGGRFIGEWRESYELEMFTPATERRYLIGKDDINLFVAQIPRGDTVAHAHQALKPFEVVNAQSRRVSVDRQGEWFFVRPGEVELKKIDQKIDRDTNAVLAKRVLGPKKSENKPHVADEVVRVETPFEREREAVYARGVVRHADHHPLVLDAWRRVVQNEEVRPDRAGRFRRRWID